MKALFVVLVFMLVKESAGQNAPEIVIPAGAIVSEVLTPDKIYQHSQFTLGKVLYRNGTETEALLNYNNFSSAIEFIGPKGDTLVIGKDLLATIKKIMINRHTYFYQKGYYELVAEYAFGKLLKRQVYVLTNREKMGAYNQFSSVAAISSYDNLTDRTGGMSRSLKVKEKITLTLLAQYFFGDENDLFLPATKKNLMRSYPLKKARIDGYLEQHKVDFRSIEDLKGLLSSLHL
jgi:hypothetical protein